MIAVRILIIMMLSIIFSLSLSLSAMFDRDHSGSISLQEFGQLFTFINQWTEVYRRYDRDNSGTIDEGEMSTGERTGELLCVDSIGYRNADCFLYEINTG